MDLNKKINGWLVVLVIGIIITVIGLLPFSFNSTKQCPEGTNTIPGGCIVGAPIGPPMWSVGLFITVVGGVAFFATRNRIK